MPFWTHLLRLILRKTHCMKALFWVKTFSNLFNHGSQMVFRSLTFSFLHKANLRQNVQNKFVFAPCFWTSSSPFGRPSSRPLIHTQAQAGHCDASSQKCCLERQWGKGCLKKKIGLSNHGSEMTDLFIHLQIPQNKKPRKIQWRSSKAGYGH